MNTKLLLAAASAAITLTALPANAQFSSDYRPHTITVREHSRQFTVDRSDRLYWELRSGPYHFKDGNTYTYTNRCWSGGDECLVRVYDPYNDVTPYGTTTAPPVGRVSYYDTRRDDYGDYDN